MTEVNVAIYRAPSLVDLAHWAIEVRKEELFFIYQILGYAKAFRFDHRQKKAIDSTEFYRYVAVTKDLKSVESLHDTISNTPVRNDDEHFNCQSWVMEALGDINHAGLITEDEYLQAVTKLQEVLGIFGIPP